MTALYTETLQTQMQHLLLEAGAYRLNHQGDKLFDDDDVLRRYLSLDAVNTTPRDKRSSWSGEDVRQ